MTEAHNAEGTTGDEDLDEFLNELETGHRYLLRGEADGAFRISGWDYELDGQVYVEWERQPEADASFPTELLHGDSVIGARDFRQALEDAYIRIDGRHLNTGSSSDLSPSIQTSVVGRIDPTAEDDSEDEAEAPDFSELNQSDCTLELDGPDLYVRFDGWEYYLGETNGPCSPSLSLNHDTVRMYDDAVVISKEIPEDGREESVEFKPLNVYRIDSVESEDETDDEDNPEIVTDGGEDVIDQLLDLEAGDDVVITADGRDLHGQVVDHFVERYEDAGYYGELLVDIELDERHVDGESVKAYGLTISATEKRSGWVHFGADIAYNVPDSEQYARQDMTPITNVRLEREDEFPRDLERTDEGYPEGTEEFQLLGTVLPGKGARVAVSSNGASDSGLQMVDDVDLEAIDGLLDSRRYTENGDTVGWVYATPETGEVLEVWIDAAYLKSKCDFSAVSHQIVVYSHEGFGSYWCASPDDRPEIMTDGGQPNPPAGDETDRPYSTEEIRDLLRDAELLRYSPGTGEHEGNVMAVFKRPNGDGIGVTMNERSETPDSLIGATVASDLPFINGSGSSYTKAFIPFEDQNRATGKIIIRNTRNMGVYEVDLDSS